MVKKTRTLKKDILEVMAVKTAMEKKFESVEALTDKKTLPRVEKPFGWYAPYTVGVALTATIKQMIALYEEAVKETNEYREKHNVEDSKKINIFDFDTLRSD
jgi:hypothetical protein